LGLSDLDRVVQELLAKGVAPATASVYAAVWRRYNTFCIQYSFTPLPVTEEMLCWFVAFLSSQAITHQTITSYLAACRYMQIMRGYPDPSASPHPRLVYVLKGAWQSVSTRRIRRLPITPEILSAIANLWASQPQCKTRILLWAAFCKGFFGFLRAGEFTCPSLIEFDNTSLLALQDLSVDSHQNPQYITVFLKRSKARSLWNGSIYIFGSNVSPTLPCVGATQLPSVPPTIPRPLIHISRQYSTVSFKTVLGTGRSPVSHRGTFVLV
jgi:hypothetical protein